MILKNSEKDHAHKESQRLYNILWSAAQKYIDDYTGETLGNQIGKSGSWVSQCQSTGSDTNFYIIQIPYLRRLFGNDFLRQIGEDIGYFLIPRPIVEKFKTGDFSEFSKVVSDFGKLMSTTGDAFQDKKISKNESADIWEKGSEAIESILAFMLAMKDKANG